MVGRKFLPAGAEVSAEAAAAADIQDGGESGHMFIRLLELVVYRKMRELALHGVCWHTPCATGRAGGSA